MAASKDSVSLLQLFRYSAAFDRLLIVAGIALCFVHGVVKSSDTIIFQHLTDVLIRGKQTWDNGTFDYDQFEKGAVKAIQMYAGLGGAAFLLGFVGMSCLHTISTRLVFRIRQKYFESLLRQDMTWFDANATGALTTKLNSGIDRIKDGAGDKMGMICVCIARLVSGVAIAFFYFSWKMTLVVLAFTPLFFMPTVIAHMIVSRVVPKEHKESSKAGEVAAEVIGAGKTVIAFNGQTKEITRYSAILDRVTKISLQRALLSSLAASIIPFSMFLCMGCTFYYGATLVISGEVSPGTTLAVFWAVATGLFEFGQAAPLLSIISSAKAAAAPIFEIIDREPSIDSLSEKGRRLTEVKGNVEFSDIHFRYPTRREDRVLGGLSLKIKAGSHVALVGHSGCGKSTLVGLLLRYYDLDKGKVTIDGVDISEVNVACLRTLVGIVSQEPSLFADSIQNNIRLGKPDLTDDEIEHVCRLANAHHFIMKLPEGYQSRIGDGGIQLSGGQKQRIAIARALARNPKILLLDEATSALDTESESIVQAALEKAGEGRTTISIAHRLSTIKNADCIFVLEKGELLESGTHVELMAANGKYVQLVKAQNFAEENIDQLIEEMDEDCESESISEFEFDESNTAPSNLPDLAEEELKDIDESCPLAAASVVASNRKNIKAKRKTDKATSLLTIIRFAREDWPLLMMGLVFSTIRGLTTPLFTLVFGRVFLTLTVADDEQKMAGAATNALMLAIISLASFLSIFISKYLFEKAGASLTKRIRVAFFSNIMSQDGEYFDKLEHVPGILTARLAADAPNIRAAIDQRLADVLNALVSIFVAMGIAFYYSPMMAPIGIASTLGLMLTHVATSEYLKRKGLKDAVKAQEPARLASEAIENHKTVAYLTREQHFAEVFQKGLEGPRRRALIRGIIESATYSLFNTYVFFNFIVCYRYGLWLVAMKEADPYIIFQVFEALSVPSRNLISIAMYYPDYLRARISAGLLFKKLQLQPKIDSLSIRGKRLDLKGEIRFNQADFAYPARMSHLVLNQFDFTAKPGQTVALVGHSGCGKSTTIQLLERFYDPLSGCITIDGCDLRDLNIQHLRSQVSLVGQEPTLFNYSIRENIEYGMAGATQQQIEEAARLANAHDFISGLPSGYETVVGERGSHLSGGQKQRIAIARAIIRNPKILLLDEASSALDTESEKIVQQALDSARADRTTIVIAHRLSSIQNADVIIVCSDGKIVEQGSHRELMAFNGLYANLFLRQKLK